MKCCFTSFFTITLVCLFGLSTQVLALDLYVASTGSDEQKGSKDHPLATVLQAQKVVRQLKAKGPLTEPVTVWLYSGTYHLGETLKFTAEDSGTPAAPIRFCALPGKPVRFIGGTTVAGRQLKFLEDADLQPRISPEVRGKIQVLDLTENNIKNVNPLPDEFTDQWNMMELYFNDHKLALSRWPKSTVNGGYAYVKAFDKNGDEKTPGAFDYDGNEPEKWVSSVADEGVWLSGFWRVPWVRNGVKVQRIDPDTKTISFAKGVGGGIGSKYSKLVNGVRIGDGKEQWFAMNLLQEITQPGEWCVDFKRRKIFIYPPAGARQGSFVVADQLSPLISFQGASDISVEGLDLTESMGDGVVVEGGERITIAGCHLHGLGNNGIVINHGRQDLVLSNDIYGCGFCGITLTGGDRVTLTPGGNQIVNNHIHHVGWKYPVAALIAGSGYDSPTVGNRVANNLIHDVSNAGIVFAGNDNVFEGNDIHHVAMDSGDVGCFYTNSGWTARGNVIRHNFLHHSMNANAIYLDDGSCGTQVLDNVVFRTATGSFISGGHDNIIQGNSFIECKVAMHIDDRGVSRGYNLTNKKMAKDLASVPVKNPPWSLKYPALVNLDQTDMSKPAGNVMQDNEVVNCTLDLRLSGKKENFTGILVGNNQVVRDSSTVLDPRTFQIQLKQIDMAKMGIFTDKYRHYILERDMNKLNEQSSDRNHFDSFQDMKASNLKP